MLVGANDGLSSSSFLLGPYFDGQQVFDLLFHSGRQIGFNHRANFGFDGEDVAVGGGVVCSPTLTLES